MLIPVQNFETVDLEKSYLSDPISEGATSIEVKNNNRFSADDRILLGEMGTEQAEIVTVSSVNANGTTVVIGATVHPHSADDPVYVLPFDQVKYYRATTSGGSYSVISTQDLDVDNADLETKYDDTTGTDSYYYKFTFYHSVSTVESAFSDVIQGSGWRRRQVGRIIDEILQEVSDPNEVHITRTELLGYFNDVNDDLQVDGKPYDFLRARTTFARTANAITLDFPTNDDGEQTMWAFDRMDYNFTDTDTDPDTNTMSTIKIISEEEFRNKYSDIEITSSNVDDGKPEAMCLDTAVNRFRYWPASENTISDAFYLHYFKYFDTIDSEGDEIETPTPKIYKLYAKEMYYQKRAVTESSYQPIADRWGGKYLAEKAKYRGINRKDRGTPRGFTPVNSRFHDYRE